MKKRIYFFEWSNLKNEPLYFDSEERFYDFLADSKISVTKRNNKFFKDHNAYYVVCKPDKNELVMSKDFRNLCKNFSKIKNKK